MCLNMCKPVIKMLLKYKRPSMYIVIFKIFNCQKLFSLMSGKC